MPIAGMILVVFTLTLLVGVMAFGLTIMFRLHERCKEHTDYRGMAQPYDPWCIKCSKIWEQKCYWRLSRCKACWYRGPAKGLACPRCNSEEFDIFVEQD